MSNIAINQQFLSDQKQAIMEVIITDNELDEDDEEQSLADKTFTVTYNKATDTVRRKGVRSYKVTSQQMEYINQKGIQFLSDAKRLLG